MIDFYRCDECGNVMAVIKKAGSVENCCGQSFITKKAPHADTSIVYGSGFTCCGQGMVLLKPGAVDAAKEKHVPVISKHDGILAVTVGSVEHPMTKEHFIEWIALVVDNAVTIHYLKPGAEPKTEFLDAAAGSVYAYCNLHGLWQTSF